MHTLEESSSSAEHAGPEVIICFLFVGLLIGAIINVLFSESKIPYTVLVFIVGMLLGVIELFGAPANIVESMKQWTNINPSLLIFVFVPALLFGEVTNLNPYHVKGSIIQAVLLAGPGAVLCTVLLGYYMSAELLPYKIHWDSNLAFLFASIMSATDPVAVVALLSKSHGSLQRMKYTITGESILNDASALVMFNIFAPGVDIGGSAMGVKDGGIYLVKVLLISPLVGGLMGLGGVFATSVTSRHYKEEHVIAQVAIPICCAYLSFYVGEEMLHVSGIITCCTAAWMFAWLSPALFANHHTLHSVWIAIEWIGNTLVFLLAGLLITTRALNHIHGRDFANLFVIFIVLHIIRSVMIVVCYPIMANVGKGCALNEAVFISYSGLRGAIAIALVLSIVQRQHFGLTVISERNAELLLFYTGGFSCLTLLINATTAGWLLSFLEIGRKEISLQEEDLVRHYARKRIIASGVDMMSDLPRAHAELVAQTCKLLVYDANQFKLRPRAVTQKSESVHSENTSLHRHGSADERSDAFEALVLIEQQRAEEAEAAYSLGPTLMPSFNAVDDIGFDDVMDISSTADIITADRQLTALGLAPQSLPFVSIHGKDDSEEIGIQLAHTTRDNTLSNGFSNPHEKYQKIAARDRRRATTIVTNEAMMTYIRDCFLHVVRTYYWKCVHTGRLSRHSVALQLLLSSVEVGLETIHTPGLQDWDFVKQTYSMSDTWYFRLYSALPLRLREASVSISSRLFCTDDDVVSVLTCFIAAHEYAQERISNYLGEESVADTIEQAVVIAESKQLVREASKRLQDEFDAEHIQLLKSMQMVRSIQHHQEDILEKMIEEGILREADAKVLFDEIHHDRGYASAALLKAYKNEGAIPV